MKTNALLYTNNKFAKKKIGNNSFNNIKIPSNKFNQGDERLLQWKEIREDTSV